MSVYEMTNLITLVFRLRIHPDRPWRTPSLLYNIGRFQLKCDDTREETRFSLSAKQTIPYISVVASVQSTTGSRGVPISGNNGSNAVYTACSEGV